MNKEEWIRRCAARYEQVTGISNADSRYFAEVCLDSLDGDLTENPEDAADDDMSHWHDW